MPKLKSLLAENANANQDDVLTIKTLLRKLGLYEVPEWGMTKFPDRELFQAIRAFQDKAGLNVDGRMKPDGETETALHKAARMLQGLGRNGDTVLAHISPAEARMLKAKGGAGTVNTRTGLLEFYATGNKEGTYIWRTQGDGKVRSSHAERDGQTFSWDDPPEGGHPGEAPNCRCEAKDVEEDKCKRLKGPLLNAEQAAREAQERMRKAADAYSKKSREVEARWQEFKRQAVAFGIGNYDAFKKLKKLQKPKSFTWPSELWDAWQAYQEARDESEQLLEAQRAAQAELDAREADAKAIREKIEENGCG